jgi:hypothetical protein
MQKKFIFYRKQLFSLIVSSRYIYIYICTQKYLKCFDQTKTKNAHQRERVLKDDIWQDLTEHESKLELVEDGIESEEEKI